MKSTDRQQVIIKGSRLKIDPQSGYSFMDFQSNILTIDPKGKYSGKFKISFLTVDYQDLHSFSVEITEDTIQPKIINTT